MPHAACPHFCWLVVCSAPPEPPMSRTVLVVDDSMLIRHTVCRYLEGIGYDVEAATNGQEALDLLQEGDYHPDLIVTDMQMPKLSGSELITALKEMPATRVIPIVILAGK